MERPTPPRQEDLDAQIVRRERELVELKRRRNGLSPISRIPQELLCEILLMATSWSRPLVPRQGNQLRAEGYIAIMCHVSSAWRYTSFSCPSLWAEIDIHQQINARQITFLVDQARTHPLSICMQENDPVCIGPKHAEFSGITAIKQILLERNLNIQELALSGGPAFLKQCLNAFSVKRDALRSLQIVNVASPGWWYSRNFDIQMTTGELTWETPRLRTLTLVNCAAPLNSSLLLSPHLTCIAVTIPPRSDVRELLNILRNTPRIQVLELKLPHDFRPHTISLPQMHAPYLTRLHLAGKGTPILVLLEPLKLTASRLHVSLMCLVPSSENPRRLGDRLFSALGRTRLPVGVDQDQKFSPSGLRIYDPLSATEPSSKASLGIHTTQGKRGSTGRNSLAYSSTYIDVHCLDEGNFARIPASEWVPILTVDDPASLLRRADWSLAELTTVRIDDLPKVSPPSSLWNCLSKIASLDHIRIAASHVSEFTPYLFNRSSESDETAAVPLPLLFLDIIGTP